MLNDSPVDCQIRGRPSHAVRGENRIPLASYTSEGGLVPSLALFRRMMGFGGEQAKKHRRAVLRQRQAGKPVTYATELARYRNDWLPARKSGVE